MKCKLSKLFFLALLGAFSLKGAAQDAEGRKKIVKDYDLNYLNKIAQDFSDKFKVNYEKALKVASEKSLPVEGMYENGAYYALKGIDEETGNLLYYKTYNNTNERSSVQTARAQHLYNEGSLGINIQGQGMILGIWDGGQPQASHQNLGISRVTNKDGQTTTNSGQSGIDHATHVAGTMIGSGLNKIEARGLAFQGFLWANTWTNDIAEMTTQAAQGLLVSNHSYGADLANFVDNPGIFGRYTAESRAVDVVTSNAPNYLPVYAAGNDRSGVNGTSTLLNSTKGGYDLMAFDAVSKNAVVVAAIEGFTTYTGASSAVMSSFSQWGPTDDFRIKPDISSKGVDVYSSSMPTVTSVNVYGLKDGTSMAAPSVTGVFALWQQYFKKLNTLRGLENMTAASVKALMAHTASQAGAYRLRGSNQVLVSQPGPNPIFGWGVINAEGGAQILKDAFKSNPTAVFKELELASGQEYVLNVTLDGTEQLNATIAWTDLPSNPVSGTDSSVSLLVNDLDLRVYLPSDTTMSNPILPYALNKSWANMYTTKADNNVDPIEKINYYSELSGLARAGVYKIKVTHKGNSLSGGKQKFTLIVSGGVVSFDESASSQNVTFKDLKVYPNPVNDVLNISGDIAEIENAKVAVFDMLGKKVYENASLFNFSGDASIDVSYFNSGVYIVEISNGNKVETKKIVVK